MAEPQPAAGRAVRLNLCRLADVADGGSAGFALEVAGRSHRLMLLRQGERIFAYDNTCPHLGWPLDIVAGRFLDASGRHILCTGHGALFRLADGVCVKGPCIGARLTAIAARVEDGTVVIELPTPRG